MRPWQSSNRAKGTKPVVTASGSLLPATQALSERSRGIRGE
jgi:hypothetical protein